ncbi:hypothetical protein D3C74_140910 [compost metagenome]
MSCDRDSLGYARFFIMNSHGFFDRFQLIKYPSLLFRQAVHQLPNSLQHTALPDRQQLNSLISLLDRISINLVDQLLLILFESIHPDCFILSGSDCFLVTRRPTGPAAVPLRILISRGSTATITDSVFVSFRSSPFSNVTFHFISNVTIQVSSPFVLAFPFPYLGFPNRKSSGDVL